MFASIYNTFLSSPSDGGDDGTEKKRHGFPRLEFILEVLKLSRPICINYTLGTRYRAIADARAAALTENWLLADAESYNSNLESAIRTCCNSNAGSAAALLYGFSRESPCVSFKDGANREYLAQGLANERTAAVWNLAAAYFDEAYSPQKRNGGRVNMQQLSCAIDYFELHSRIAPKLGFGNSLDILNGAFFANAKHGKIMSLIANGLWFYETMLVRHEKDPMHNDLEDLSYWMTVLFDQALKLCIQDTAGVAAIVEFMLEHADRWWTLNRLSRMCDSSKVEISHAAAYHMALIVAAAEKDEKAMASRLASLSPCDSALMQSTLTKTRQFAGIDSWFVMPYIKPPEMPDCSYKNGLPKQRFERRSVISLIN